MRRYIVILILAMILAPSQQARKEFEEDNNDFAEFDFDDEVEKPPVPVADEEEDEEEDDFASDTNNPSEQEGFPNEEDEDEAVVEDVDSDFNHFADEEEFEGYHTDDMDEDDDEGDEFEHVSTKGRGAKEKPVKGQKTSQQQPPPPKTINITKIPAHLRTNWENYYLELLMIAGLVVYFLNFFAGKTKNQRLANAWFNAHKSLLESNFALVGDDGAKNMDEIDANNTLQKDSENLFTLWCSGRTCCEGMLVELKLLKRQDLVSVIGQMMKSNSSGDQVRIRVHMNPEDMDNFVFCLAQKKAGSRLAKEMADITTFCPEKRNASLEKFGVTSSSAAGAQYCVMSELPEVTAAILGDSKMVAVLNKYPEAVDSIHFSDQYTGPKLPDDQTPAELPEGKKMLIFTFNFKTAKGTPLEESVEAMKPLMLLVFYFMDKIKRFRLSREAKNKADKHRSMVTEAFWKSIHAAKAERAQEERERKRREIKERIKEIEDPDKQRKLEERELRRERKKAAPKMKQLKVKAM